MGNSIFQKFQIAYNFRVENNNRFIDNLIPSGNVTRVRKGNYILGIPFSKKNSYGIGQLDDYKRLPRGKFKHSPPLHFSIIAKTSHMTPPGTWGFGFWNDPFNLSLGFGGGVRRFPALPNAVWFFYGSHPNYLALTNKIPSHGIVAATFKSPRAWNLILPITAPFFPLVLWKSTATKIRYLATKIVQQDARQMKIDPTEWHTYEIFWFSKEITFTIDGSNVFNTQISPNSPLGLVIWIDNQYISFAPNDILRSGILPAKSGQELTVKNISIEYFT